MATKTASVQIVILGLCAASTVEEASVDVVVVAGATVVDTLAPTATTVATTLDTGEIPSFVVSTTKLIVDSDHEKQAAHGWGEEKDGNAEWNDERAGDAIARAESKDEPGFTPDTSAGDPAFTNGPGAEGEVVGEDAVAPPEEDKTKSYDQYLAEQAEKRLALGDNSLQTRKANEGSKQKFPEGTAVERNPEQENFFIGGGGKARREKASGREKNTLNLDGQYYKDPDSSERGGGRGRGRGRGRGGEGRGDRGGERGAGGRGGRGRGEFRGGPRGDRGDRGGPGGPRGAINTSDQSAFPALGGS